MRLALVVIAGCSFHTQELGPIAKADAPRAGDAPVAHDAPIDAAPDAPPDAPSMCVTHATTTFGGHHYFATANASWTAAETACESFGGHLVKLETQGEDQFVTSTLTAGSYTWIGLHDPTGTNIYVWADLTPLTVYDNFPGGTPPASASDCVDTNGTWDTFGCSQTNHGGTCECE
jgi:hypothetical protein